jgi:hypothetical protein
MSPQVEKFLCFLLVSVVASVCLLGFFDPSTRPAVLDFAKVALGGILTAISATTATKLK